MTQFRSLKVLPARNHIFAFIRLSITLSFFSPSLVADDLCQVEDYLRAAHSFISEIPEQGDPQVKGIAGAFAALHLTKPNLILWPGMAAIAQNQFVTYILNSNLATKAVKVRAISTTKEIYVTGFTPLLIYLTGGIQAINRLQGTHPILDEEAVRGIRQLDAGRVFTENDDSRARTLVLKGNGTLLAQEHAILQQEFYQYPLGALGPALSAFACTNFSDSPLGVKCFAAAFPFSSFRNQRKRTAWNVDVLLPSFAEHFLARQGELEDIKSAGETAGAYYPNLDSWRCEDAHHPRI